MYAILSVYLSERLHQWVSPQRQQHCELVVLGAGLMGGGIALVCARAGLDVALLDVSEEAARQGLERLRRQEEAAVAAGRADADTVKATLSRITPVGDYAALHDADIVVEAVFEDRAVKAEATRRAEAALAANVVFATNTSTLPITGLAAVSKRPGQFIGLHFFSPVPRMPLLEIIRGERTAANLALITDLCQTLKFGSLCALGGFTPYPVMSAIKHFPEDFDRPRLKAAAA